MHTFSQSLNEGISNYYKISFGSINTVEEGKKNMNDPVRVYAPGRFGYIAGAAAAPIAIIADVARACFTFLRNVLTLFRDKGHYLALKQYSFNFVAHLAAIPVGLFGALFPAKANSFLKIPSEGVELPFTLGEYSKIRRQFWNTTVENFQYPLLKMLIAEDSKKSVELTSKA